MMGIQQISDRVRTAPTQALRAVFAGIGRILMTADRPESQTAAAPSRSSNRPSEPVSRHQQVSQAAASWRDLDKTGNVRLLSAEDMALEFGVGRVDSPGQISEINTAEPGPVTLSAALPTAELPLTGYDDLSLASIRARLRSLDVSQLRVLAEYERANAARPDVFGMFERRIEKLETGG